MLLAKELSPPVAIFVGVALIIGFAVFALYFYRGYEYLARKSLQRKFADLAIHADPQPGDVLLTYHTYHGFIAWFTQTTHVVALPPDDARKLLGRLLRFNLTWGVMILYGAFFIPLLAIGNYFAQRRSIAEQQASGGIKIPDCFAHNPAMGDQRAHGETSNPYATVVNEFQGAQAAPAPSFFRRVLGWTTAFLATIFAITALVGLVTRQAEAVFGGFLVAGVFALIARDFLRKKH